MSIGSLDRTGESTVILILRLSLFLFTWRKLHNWTWADITQVKIDPSCGGIAGLQTNKDYT